jgi:hypothetical protein
MRHPEQDTLKLVGPPAFHAGGRRRSRAFTGFLLPDVTQHLATHAGQKFSLRFCGDVHGADLELSCFETAGRKRELPGALSLAHLRSPVAALPVFDDRDEGGWFAGMDAFFSEETSGSVARWTSSWLCM